MNANALELAVYCFTAGDFTLSATSGASGATMVGLWLTELLEDRCKEVLCLEGLFVDQSKASNDGSLLG